MRMTHATELAWRDDGGTWPSGETSRVAWSVAWTRAPAERSNLVETPAHLSSNEILKNEVGRDARAPVRARAHRPLTILRDTLEKLQTSAHPSVVAHSCSTSPSVACAARNGTPAIAPRACVNETYSSLDARASALIASLSCRSASPRTAIRSASANRSCAAGPSAAYSLACGNGRAVLHAISAGRAARPRAGILRCRFIFRYTGAGPDPGSGSGSDSASPRRAP